MQAIILAAGIGNRMMPITKNIPKPLVKFKQQHLIEYSIKSLQRAGITDIVINIFYLGDQIKDILQNGRSYGVNIRYSEENQLLNTGYGIKNAINNRLLTSSKFIAISSDIICDFDLNTIQPKLTKLAHLVLVPNPSFNLPGDFRLDHTNNNLLLMPKINHNHLNYTFSGIGIFTPEFFVNCPNQPFPLINPIKQAISDQQITGELYLGSWKNIGSIEQLSILEP